MSNVFVSRNALKRMSKCCANCGWAKLPVDERGRILKGESGKCNWHAPSLPFMVGPPVQLNLAIAAKPIWWDTGTDCPAWRNIVLTLCKSCIDTIPFVEVTEEGLCSMCVLNQILGLPLCKVKHASVCHGCTNPVNKEQVEDWGGWCDECIETGRNFDRGHRPPKSINYVC
jgi:hypothetical protein